MGRVSRFAVTLLVGVVLLLAFASSALATNYLGYSVDTSVGEGNPLGNIHSETSPVPNGDVALWYNHSVSLHDWYLADTEAPDTFAPDEITYVRTFPAGGESESVDNTLTIAAEGLYSINATTVVPGQSGDTTYAAGVFIGLDKTKPMSWSSAVPVYDAQAVVNLSASDALSGVEFIAYSLDNAPVDELLVPPMFVSTVTGRGLSFFAGPPVTVTAGAGSHTLTYWALDNAGNLGKQSTVRFTVNALGYTPVLSRPVVSAASHHLTRFRGSVTAAATNKTVKLAIQRKSHGVMKNYVNYYAPVSAYGTAYSLTGSLPRGAYRVRALQGSGASGWRTFTVR
jgi:hypothetical protein